MKYEEFLDRWRKTPVGEAVPVSLEEAREIAKRTCQLGSKRQYYDNLQAMYDGTFRFLSGVVKIVGVGSKLK